MTQRGPTEYQLEHGKNMFLQKVVSTGALFRFGSRTMPEPSRCSFAARGRGEVLQYGHGRLCEGHSLGGGGLERTTDQRSGAPGSHVGCNGDPKLRLIQLERPTQLRSVLSVLAVRPPHMDVQGRSKTALQT